MAVANKQTLPVKQGDVLRFVFTSTHTTGSVTTPLDISGARVEFSVAKEPRKTPRWSWFSDDASGRVAIVDAEEGKVAVELLPEDSRAWGKIELLAWELTVEFSETDRLTTSQGFFSVDLEVAHLE